jgi:NAD+ kinase
MTARKLRILIIRKRSLLELLHLNKSPRIVHYLNSFPNCHSELQRAKDAHINTLDVVKQCLDRYNCQYAIHTRTSFRKSFLKNIDLVITIGGDGTLLEIARYVTKIPILGVNSDPKKSIGHFCTTNSLNFAAVFTQFFKNNALLTYMPRMAISIDGKVSKQLILNDVYVTNQNHGEMIRIDVRADTKKTLASNQYSNLFFSSRCTGFLICTSMGSSAWMYNEGGVIQPVVSTDLQYKELGKRHATHGFTKKLEIVSHMPKGIVCIDGSHRTMKFGFGQKLILYANQHPTIIVGDVKTKHDNLIKK